MNHVFVVQVKNTKNVVEHYKKKINEVIIIKVNTTTGIKAFLNLNI